MVVRLFTAVLQGLEVHQVEVEVDLSPSLPGIVIVGLPDKSVQESKERIRSGIKQCGLEFPLGKITVNLAPADLAKSGSGFDCAIGLGVLLSSGLISSIITEKVLILGELALDGSIRGVQGILPACLWARGKFDSVIIPEANAGEVALVSNVKVISVSHLSELIQYFEKKEGGTLIQPVTLEQINSERTKNDLYEKDFAYIKGQMVAKRALEIAACGGHNVLMIGEPGSGKTMLARAFPTILPPMTEQEILEVSQIYSVSSAVKHRGLVIDRPFRSPHHSASHIALVGGGSRLLPGEISLAHRGVLFLDEFPEFTRESIEALRQPLEDGVITISRATGRVTYPSRFILIAAANPTPGGFWQKGGIIQPGHGNTINNSPNAIKKYQSKFSGPIIDRIDLVVEVDRPQLEHLKSTQLQEKSVQILERVIRGREIQNKRFNCEKIVTNSEMTPKHISQWCKLHDDAQKILDNAVEKLHISARGYHRILKLSRTIADLDGSEAIEINHIAESLQYRQKQNVFM